MKKLSATDGRELYRDFQQLWERAKEKILPMEKERSEALSKYVLMPFIHKGRELSKFILENKEVPSSEAKSLEMATRAFLSVRRKPRKPKAWLQKKEKRIRFLLNTESLPEKSVGGDSLFELGPFKIHNTVGAEGKELELIKDLIRKATKFIGKCDVPFSNKGLYGDIYLVGRLQRAHTLAWYDANADNISLRVRSNIDSDAVQSLIHEFGHRMWRKHLDRSVKTQWSRWHHRVEFKDDMPLPDVGDPLGFELKGMKEPIIQKIVHGDKFYVSEDGYLTRKQIRDAYVQEFSYPTRYAATNKEEHFCEAYSLYALGVLGTDHERMFSKIVIRGEDLD